MSSDPLYAFLELLCVEELRQKELRSQDIHLASSPIKGFTKAVQEQEWEATRLLILFWANL